MQNCMMPVHKPHAESRRFVALFDLEVSHITSEKMQVTEHQLTDPKLLSVFSALSVVK